MKIKEVVKLMLNQTFPGNDITSIYGEYDIRFELGGELDNGTNERVVQAVNRATEIFDQTIGSDDILLVVEEYSFSLFDRKNKNMDYLYSLLDKSKIQRFPGPFEQVYYEKTKKGVLKECVSEDPLYCDLLVGRFSKGEINIPEIIRGIANYEMGIKPCVPQDVTFFAPQSSNGFRMYDDRGCDIWSKNKENLRPIYTGLNSWILDYNRKRADWMFRV